MLRKLLLCLHMWSVLAQTIQAVSVPRFVSEKPRLIEDRTPPCMEDDVSRVLVSLENTIRDLKKNYKFSLEGTQGVCEEPFTLVGGTCLHVHLALEISWKEAKKYCLAKESDLASFKTPNEFAEVINYVKDANIRGGVDVWIGGSDLDNEGHWVFTDGSHMPMSSPFWGKGDVHPAQPQGGLEENCAVMRLQDSCYLHDVDCNNTNVALCQKRPHIVTASDTLEFRDAYKKKIIV